MAAISGTVTDSAGAFASKLVRAYRRDTGVLVGQALSDPATGAYSIQTADTSEHFVIAHDATGDPNFDKVSLCLLMDGSNGSTAFTDSSPTPKTVTASGNAQISTAQSKFGGASAYFDGTGDYLTVASSADINFGAGDFTIEMFAHFTAVPGAGGYTAFISRRDSGTTNISYNLWYGGTEKFYFSYSTNGTTQVNSATLNSVTPVTGQWYHIALVRSGANVDIYIDGVKGTTHSIGTSSLFASTSVLRIGAANSTPTFFMAGYIDELRITKGVARYTDNFTPPTEAFLTTPSGGDLNAVIYDRLTPA